MTSQKNPIRLFVSHSWQESDDYSRVFEYLEAPGTFYYRTTGEPQRPRPIDKESQREELRRQIGAAEVVIILPTLFLQHKELVTFQVHFSKSADKPIVAMEYFGSKEPLPALIKENADEISGWNERDLIDALKRQARHEDTTRWDTIEFKLD
jgi:hypothetical protein